jgi:AraC-like DNA-binding protein
VYGGRVAGLEIVTMTPAGALAGQVRRLAGFRETAPPLRRREVPLAGATIVLSLGPDLWVDGGWTGSFAAGLYDRPVVTGHAGTQEGLQLDVSPLGARSLLGVPMSELYDVTVPLEDVLPGARELTERVAEARGWAARRAVVAAFVERLEPRPLAPELRWAYARLERSHGAARVEELARETGWSRRHLTQRFREEIGMPPKAFARLLRFERAIGLLRAGEPLAEAAYAAGYADQPHMNRDFRDFYGAPPGELPFVQDAAAAA